MISESVFVIFCALFVFDFISWICWDRSDEGARLFRGVLICIEGILLIFIYYGSLGLLSF